MSVRIERERESERERERERGGPKFDTLAVVKSRINEVGRDKGRRELGVFERGFSTV